MKRRLLAGVLTFVMVLSLLPTAVLASDEPPKQETSTEDSQGAQNGDQQQQKTEAEPQEQSKEISSEGGTLTTGNYVLNEDVELSKALTVPEDAVVTIDLNGHTLTGTRKDSVIVVNGVLTVKDSSGDNSGKITGGTGHKNDQYGHGGGAISIENGGKCTLEGGTLTGNHCDDYNYNAGGVYAKGTAEFYMTGGVITGNTANRQGGGVFGGGSSTIVISGGEISDNTAQFGGGVCYNGKMTMTGGTIKNNTAQYSGEFNGESWPNIMGGGIKVNSSSPLEFYGGEVFGNKAISTESITAQGAGIYGGDIKVMGDVKVFNNKRDDAAENVYLDGSAMLEIVGELDKNAQLPVTRATQTGRVTSNGSRYPFGDGIITADDSALKLETRKGDLYFTKDVDSNAVICTMQVGGQTLEYDSLSAALADLPSDDNVITLLKNIDLGAQVSVPANSGAATITSAEGEEPVVITWENATASYFNVPTGAELTVSGNIIIRGSENNGQRAFDVAGTLNFGEASSAPQYPMVKQFDLTNDKDHAAAIYVKDGTLNLYSGTLSQNKGYYGGAVSVQKDGNANLFGGTISGNTAPSGGGLYVANSTVTLSGTKISKNRAKQGGGIYNQHGIVTIEQGEISGNWVDGENLKENPNGGGIFNDNTGTVTMNGGKINENAVKVNVDAYGRGRGAAVYNSGTFTITAGTVSGNYCEQGNSIKETTMYCAGLYNQKEMYIAGGTISDNYYKFSDGANNSKCFSGVGVTNNGGTLTISGGTITGNGIQSGDSSVAGIAGAGVASTANTENDAEFKMTGGTITGNNGGTGFGAGLYLDNSGDHTSTATISGGSIVGNTGASGVYAANANLSISGNPVISGQKTNLYLGSNKITLSALLTSGASIGVTTETSPASNREVQITSTETDTEYYKDAAQYFIPDAASVIARANEGKYVELAYTADHYYTVTLHLSHASVSTGSPTTMVKNGESCTIAIKADEGYTLPEVTQSGVTYARNNDKTTATVTVKPTANTNITIAAIPKPTNADLANGEVAVKCLTPTCSMRGTKYGLNQAVVFGDPKPALTKIDETHYTVTYDADAFASKAADKRHSLYSADTLTWKLTYDGSKWNLKPQHPGVDDVVLVTHAPTTFDEVTKFIDGRTDVIKTSCVNGETATCAYGLMVAFVKPDHVVSVEQEKNSSGEPIPGSYIATLKMDQFAETCAKACNDKSFADSPRAHDVLSKNPVQWRFKVTQAEVTTDTGAEKQYVWSAEPVEEGKDDVCQVAHNWVVTFDPANGENTFTQAVKYEGKATAPDAPEKTGYTFDGWYLNGKEFNFETPITENITLTAAWETVQYTITYDLDYGTVAGTNPTEYNITSSDITLINPTKTGYTFKGWSGTDLTGDGNKSVTIPAGSTGDRSYTANWTANTYTVTFDKNAADATLGTASKNVTYGGTYSDLPTPVRAGFNFAGWFTAAAEGEKIESSTVCMTANDHTLYAHWTAKEIPALKITATPNTLRGGGKVTLTVDAPNDAGTITVKYKAASSGDETTLTPNGDGKYAVTLPNRTETYTFTVFCAENDKYAYNTASCTVSVTRRHTSSVTPGNTVSVPSTPNGTVTVSPSTASKGETVTITTKPSEGYELGSIEVLDKNGDSLKLKDLGNGKYSFVMPDGKVSVEAEFVKTAATSFADVPANAYFADAVKWAVDKGITNGLSDTMFGPYESCTRAQIVTFLWRAAGSPEPKTVSSFTDVPASAYYAKAVAWAVENGITNGMTATMFAPDATCTRGQSVTFLYRALKGTASGSANFTDVKSDAFYADAINWAVANNVTNGTSNTTFSPNADCTRAEIVTFLYRAYQGK